MAKHAFTVEDGLVPGHTTSSLGHTARKFADAHMSGNVNVGGDITVTGDISSSGTIYVQGETVTGGGGGGTGGVDASLAIAYSIALGQ